MQYLFSASSLTRPTFETLETYSQIMFKKVERLLTAIHEEPVIRISVHKEGSEFVLTVEISAFKNLTIIKEKNRDLRRAIEAASKDLKFQLAKTKSKKTNHKHPGFKEIIKEIV